MRSAILLPLMLVVAAETPYAQGELLPPDRERCTARPACAALPQPTVERVRSDVRATLGERVVRYEVSETFVNNGRAVAEADYLLPLPRNAAFRDLRLFINGEPVAGEVIGADRARSIYEEIVRRQRDPALVEWMGQGLLRARIFPIAPGERKQVLVRYDAVAEREGDAYRIDYFRGARGGGRQPRVTPAAGEPAADEVARESFSLRYPARLGRAYSPTHRVALRDSAGVRTAVVVGSGNHITLLVPVPRSESISLAAVSHAAGGDRHVLLAIAPPLGRALRIPRDVTVVMDVSGSMSGEKIRQAREAGTQVLRSLTSDDAFRLIDFASDVRTFREQFTPVTDQNVAAGVEYLRRLRAAGGTNIEGALEEALSAPSAAGRLPLVLFITDGMPTVGETDADALAQLVAQNRRNRRIFTFGVGADVNVALLEQLAIDGRGTAHFVRSSESIEHAVSTVASRLAQPVLTDVRVQVGGGIRLRDIYPRLPVDVFAGQDLVLLARYDGAGATTVRISGRSGGREVSVEYPVVFPASERRNDFVPRLWAVRRIGHLVAERRRSADRRELDEEIRALALRYGVPSDLSSYLVLEPDALPGNRIVRAPAPSAPAAGGVDLSRRRTPSEVHLSEIVVAGAITGGAAFESARAAAAQREARTIASDEAGPVRSLAGRTFRQEDSIWVQVAPVPGHAASAVRIKPYSTAYFQIMDRVPELQSIFALGDRVRVHGRRVTLELHDSGLEELTAELLRQVERGW